MYINFSPFLLGGLPLYGFYDTFVEFIPFNEEVPIRSSTESNVRRYVQTYTGADPDLELRRWRRFFLSLALPDFLPSYPCMSFLQDQESCLLYQLFCQHEHFRTTCYWSIGLRRIIVNYKCCCAKKLLERCVTCFKRLPTFPLRKIALEVIKNIFP